MAHRLSRSSTSIVKKRCVGNDLYGASTCFPVKNGGEAAKNLLPCSQELYHERPARGCYMCFLLGKFIYVCVRVCGCSNVLHLFVNSYKLYDSSPLSKYSFLCRSRYLFFATRTRHHALEYAGQMMSVNFLTQTTPYSSLNIRTLYDSDDERTSAR